MDDGSSIPDWSGRRAAQALDRVRALGRRHRAPCQICGQRIDYNLPARHPQGCTVQHKKSRKHFPQLTWDPTNWAPAHNECNNSAGTEERAATDAVTSQEW